MSLKDNNIVFIVVIDVCKSTRHSLYIFILFDIFFNKMSILYHFFKGLSISAAIVFLLLDESTMARRCAILSIIPVFTL